MRRLGTRICKEFDKSTQYSVKHAYKLIRQIDKTDAADAVGTKFSKLSYLNDCVVSSTTYP